MASLVGLTLIKSFDYRADAAEEYSNTYHLTGSIPADSAAWKTLADALILQEKTCYPAAVSVVRAYGYDSDAADAVSVWSYDYAAASASVPGTYGGAFVEVPGDVAYFAYWKLDKLNTRGKPVYLRKYFHGGGASSGDKDAVATTLKTAVGNFATKLADGSFTDARTIRSRVSNDDILSQGCGPWLTTRTLKRRGKRPGA